jgi:hypothetical protein
MYFCITRPDGKLECYFIPFVILRWKDFFMPAGPISRVFRPLRIALISLLMGPRPSPWRQAGVRISPDVERDLLALSAMHSLAEELSPELRGSVQDTLRSASQQIPLPRGATVRA